MLSRDTPSISAAFPGLMNSVIVSPFGFETNCLCALCAVLKWLGVSLLLEYGQRERPTACNRCFIGEGDVNVILMAPFAFPPRPELLGVGAACNFSIKYHIFEAVGSWCPAPGVFDQLVG